MECLSTKSGPTGTTALENIRELWVDVETYVLLRENLASFGPEWHRILNLAKEDPYGYTKEHFKRELSEAYFGADKERLGRKIPQRIESRRETAAFGTAILHDLFNMWVMAT